MFSSTGTTTVLTMTFLALDTRDELPRVSYATALDLYVAMCFIFVLSTLGQFAIVHSFTKKGHSDTYGSQCQDMDCDTEKPAHVRRLCITKIIKLRVCLKI